LIQAHFCATKAAQGERESSHQFMSDVTRLLEATGRGDAGAADRLLEIVYAELHRMAEQKFASEAAGHTLQPTALVHDAWRQLTDGESGFQNRAHFFAAAAEAMRRVLIDHARRKRAQKRGGGQERLELDSVTVAVNADNETLLRIDEALGKLAQEDPASAELVRLRFFVGLRNEEAAEVLGISERTAKRYWTFARAWLYDELLREL
jgi:RNA polymerase sigma factor (TIGR02999 family)